MRVLVVYLGGRESGESERRKAGKLTKMSISRKGKVGVGLCSPSAS